MSNPKYLNFGRLMVISLGFLVLFMSFLNIQNLSGQTLEDNGFGAVGFYSNAVLQAVSMLMCFFAVPVNNKLGFKWSILLAGSTYAFYAASFILPGFRSETDDPSQWYLGKTFISVTVLMGAAINGLGDSIMWIVGPNYVANCANEENKGLYNSIFWAAFQAAGVVGNIFAAYIIDDVKESTFYMGMTGVSIAGVIIFIFIRQPLKQPKEVTRDLAIGASTKDSALLQDTQGLMEQQENNAEEEGQEAGGNVKEELVKTFKMMIDKKMLLLHMLWAWTGVSQTF